MGTIRIFYEQLWNFVSAKVCIVIDEQKRQAAGQLSAVSIWKSIYK